MRVFRRLLACAALFMCCASFVQSESGPPKFVARVHRTLISANTGLHSVCAIVHEDGTYRLEDLQQDMVPGLSKPNVKIYIDTLPAPAMQRLREIIDNPDFVTIKSPVHQDQIISVVEQIAVAVPRSNGVQDFSFLDPESRKPHDKALKPLVEWLRNVRDRKVQAQKNAVSNKCEE